MHVLQKLMFVRHKHRLCPQPVSLYLPFLGARNRARACVRACVWTCVCVSGRGLKLLFEGDLDRAEGVVLFG